MNPLGGYIGKNQKLDFLPNRQRKVIVVSNVGDRPIQVGSHYHFFEVNSSLVFEREKTLGFRLCIPSGTALRFEPGMSIEVILIEYGGHKKITGFSGALN